MNAPYYYKKQGRIRRRKTPPVYADALDLREIFKSYKNSGMNIREFTNAINAKHGMNLRYDFIERELARMSILPKNSVQQRNSGQIKVSSEKEVAYFLEERRKAIEVVEAHKNALFTVPPPELIYAKSMIRNTEYLV